MRTRLRSTRPEAAAPEQDNVIEWLTGSKVTSAKAVRAPNRFDR
jgi:hypothetical protein